jgi:hypothetical protein
MKGRLNKERKQMPVPVLGKIKIGMKNAKGYPQSLDYFVPHSDFKVFEDMFRSALGDKPNRISIVFVSDDVRDSCEENLELRDKSGALFCKSDGEVYRVVNNGEWIDYKASEMKEKYGSIEEFEKRLISVSGGRGFKRRLTLKFMCIDVKGLLGVWMLTTYADKSSIDNIINTFDSVMEFAGTVKMLPFDLVVSKVKKDMSGSKSVYPVLKLVPNHGIDNLTKVKTLGQGQISGLIDQNALNNV